ncbi:CRACD-like protein isoform X2 [Eleutherodactylus coqui]|uniref:CRACD-like protein isoform X2 n=1 Tax=Eleutherodactylus coqui TaxID=57060 RepID=UPI0034627110
MTIFSFPYMCLSSHYTVVLVLENDGKFAKLNKAFKKKFKFKSFKKLFVKKKRKETLPSLGASGLKQSQSASDVTISDSLRVEYDSEDELKATAGVLGSRAVSHDSIFIPEVTQETALPIRVFSQENVSDRIRALQLKLQSNMKVGPPPFGLLNKRSDDAGTSSEDDGLPRSPPEMSLIHDAIKTRFSDIHRHHHSSLSLAGTGSEEDEQISSETSSRPLSPDENELKESHKRYPEKRESAILSPSADFSSPPQYSTFLDNSAARHRLSVKPRNQRLSKNRRPSMALQDESFKNLTCMEEEDITTPRPEETVYSSTDADSSATDNIVDVSLEDKEASSESLAVNEPLNLPEVVQARSTSESENVLSISDAANVDLSAEIKDPGELVGGRLSENVPISLPTEEKEVFTASSTDNQKHTVKESKAPADVHVKPSVVEETVVHSSRTTSVGHSLESLNSRRSLFQNSLSEKRLNYQDQPLSDKENKQLGNEDKKVEKTPTETVTQRKFSVSSAWERPRTGSFSLKANVENEAHKTTKLSVLKSGMSKTEILKEEPKVALTNTENKSISKKTESLTDPEGMPADKAAFTNIIPNQSAVPAANDLPVVTELQADSEDKNPFSVKLRSTFQSLRYRDGVNTVSSMVKRHSAEFKQAKTNELSFSKEELNTEKAENKDYDVLSSKSEYAKCKLDSTEGTHAKPPLPKKPVLQNITVADNNTNKEALENVSNQERNMKCSEAKIEKKVPDRRPSLNKTIDKNTPVGTAEFVKAAESKTEPSWMSMARQKQKSLKEDRSVSEHSIVNQDSEKQNKDRAEFHSKQQTDLIQSKTTSTSVSVLPEMYGQDTKAEKNEQRQRANTLPHPVHATQLSLLTEKEEKILQKQQTFSASQEPSWMELAKKKSQAWSDKPHIIK